MLLAPLCFLSGGLDRATSTFRQQLAADANKTNVTRIVIANTTLSHHGNDSNHSGADKGVTSHILSQANSSLNAIDDVENPFRMDDNKDVSYTDVSSDTKLDELYRENISHSDDGSPLPNKLHRNLNRENVTNSDDNLVTVNNSDRNMYNVTNSGDSLPNSLTTTVNPLSLSTPLLPSNFSTPIFAQQPTNSSSTNVTQPINVTFIYPQNVTIQVTYGYGLALTFAASIMTLTSGVIILIFNRPLDYSCGNPNCNSHSARNTSLIAGRNRSVHEEEQYSDPPPPYPFHEFSLANGEINQTNSSNVQLQNDRTISRENSVRASIRKLSFRGLFSFRNRRCERTQSERLPNPRHSESDAPFLNRSRRRSNSADFNSFPLVTVHRHHDNGDGASAGGRRSTNKPQDTPPPPRYSFLFDRDLNTSDSSDTFVTDTPMHGLPPPGRNERESTGPSSCLRAHYNVIEADVTEPCGLPPPIYSEHHA
jgi:hypothetical protein